MWLAAQRLFRLQKKRMCVFCFVVCGFGIFDVIVIIISTGRSRHQVIYTQVLRVLHNTHTHKKQHKINTQKHDARTRKNQSNFPASASHTRRQDGRLCVVVLSVVNIHPLGLGSGLFAHSRVPDVAVAPVRPRCLVSSLRRGHKSNGSISVYR